jgi:hypothetical protein
MMTGFVHIRWEIILRPDKKEYGRENNYWRNGPR